MKKISNDKDATIELKNITKKYDNILAVNDISFRTSKGEIIALLGPNGAGKSTLMNMIAGFIAPSGGNIFVNGNNVSEDDMSTKRDIGFLSEGAPLYYDMTVKLFLKYMIELKLNLETQDKNEIKKTYKDELDRIVSVANIEDVLEQRIDTLSKGYVRRVGFAQSIIGNPSVLLLDEPTDGLDPNQKDYMKSLIKDMGKGKTIMISTHLLDEAENVATRIILINKGNIVANGELKDILKQTKCSSLDDAFRKLTI
ncbi:MAG: ABC transporter ATP-binding protein [Alphaproteobacteria bacterium]|nr:ABC transporter ATP-binding protein [Alphaproteobacteria bacterium]